LFIVGLRDGGEFEFPPFQGSGASPRLRDILEPNPDPRFTITDRLWAYLPAYAERHRQRGNGFGFGLADLDGATRTLSARYHKDGAEILIPQEGKNPRRLTPTECRRLMGFPEEFKIVVSNTQAYRQFGNSVVVPVVAELAARVKEYLDGTRSPATERALDEAAPAEVGTRALPGFRLAKGQGSLPGAADRDDGAADPGRAGGARLVGVR
jgi:DNA (cytosine-5)-methyltransferase 1